MADPTMFVRKASGLVRAWSVFDGFIYAFFSVNLITLGLYIFASAPSLPTSHLVPAIIVSTIFIVFECVVYGMLVSIMPRAGGDYVWQSRILGSGLGFVLTIVGWVFTLWLWTPIYGSMLSYFVLTPILAVLGGWIGSAGVTAVAMWFSTSTGLFVADLLVVILVFFLISAGMKWYARFQKTCFFIGIVGLVLMIVYLLAGSQASFMAGFNHYSTAFLGAQGCNLYQWHHGLCHQEQLYPGSVQQYVVYRLLRPDSDGAILEPVAELGVYPIRRSPGRQRFPAQLLGHGRRPADHGGHGHHSPRPVCQNLRLGLLP